MQDILNHVNGIGTARDGDQRVRLLCEALRIVDQNAKQINASTAVLQTQVSSLPSRPLYYAAAYASPFSPTLDNGIVQRITLTGDITILAPVGSWSEIEFMLLQDGIGGRAVTWNAAYIGVANYGIDGTPNTVSHFRFIKNENAKWILRGRPTTREPWA